MGFLRGRFDAEVEENGIYYKDQLVIALDSIPPYFVRVELEDKEEDEEVIEGVRNPVLDDDEKNSCYDYICLHRRIAAIPPNVCMRAEPSSVSSESTCIFAPLSRASPPISSIRSRFLSMLRFEELHFGQ